MKAISVFLIEDDPMVREVNKGFIEKIEGCEVVGVAANGKAGLEQIEIIRPELVFLDIYMPEQDGVMTLRKIREKHVPVEVIAVTAANDRETIRHVLQYGAFDYIMKPFTFDRIKQAIEKYAQYRERFLQDESFTQDTLDMLLHSKDSEVPGVKDELPKGLNPATMEKILQFIQTKTDPVSAEAVAEGVGLARVTARRYLEYLEKRNKVEIILQYGGIGRPVNRYIPVNGSR
ncbi:MAG: response regulator [Bacillus sp. (in: firmicutes)]